MSNDRSDYEIGYKKPPAATQFKAGHSGNPKGRPKGSRNFGTILHEELNTKVNVTEGGKRRKITKREAIAKQLVNKAAAGDPRAIPLVINEDRVNQLQSPAQTSATEFLSPEDEIVFANAMDRLRQFDLTRSDVNAPQAALPADSDAGSGEEEPAP